MRIGMTHSILKEVQNERVAQDLRWGVQSHPTWFPGHEKAYINWYTVQATTYQVMNDTRVDMLTKLGHPRDRNCTWDTIWLEEVFEALSEEHPLRRREELVQATAVSVAMIEHIDRERLS